MNLAPKPGPYPGPRRDARGSGFTLVEVMVATVLLSMIILSILAVLIGAYRVAAKARYNDHARYIVKSFGDQFLTQDTTDALGNTLEFFIATTTTGYGMSWTNSDGSTVSGSNGSASMPILLGDTTGAPITANVSRTVWYLYPSGANIGQPTSTPQNASAGCMLRADFTISYTFLGQALSQTISVVRAVP